MIITGDESLIEQIQNSNDSSLIQSFIIEPKDDDNEFCHSLVRKKNFFFLQEKNMLSFMCIVYKRSTSIKFEENKKWFIDLCCLWFNSTWI